MARANIRFNAGGKGGIYVLEAHLFWGFAPTPPRPHIIILENCELNKKYFEDEKTRKMHQKKVKIDEKIKKKIYLFSKFGLESHRLVQLLFFALA